MLEEAIGTGRLMTHCLELDFKSPGYCPSSCSLARGSWCLGIWGQLSGKLAADFLLLAPLWSKGIYLLGNGYLGMGFGGKNRDRSLGFQAVTVDMLLCLPDFLLHLRETVVLSGQTPAPAVDTCSCFLLRLFWGSFSVLGLALVLHQLKCCFCRTCTGLPVEMLLQIILLVSLKGFAASLRFPM